MSGRYLSMLVLLATFTTLATGRAHSEIHSNSAADTLNVPIMIQVSDDRNLGAIADYMGFHGEDARYPAGFDPWTPGEAEAFGNEAHVCDDGSGEFCSYGYATGYAFQFSQFFPQAIQFNGSSMGKWIGQPSGTYSAHSLASFRFRMEVPFTYRLFARLTPGDTPGYVAIEGPTSDVKYFYLTAGGVMADSGQLGPGEYVAEGFSSVGPSSEEDTQGAVYSLQWEVDPYIYRALGLQPGDQTVACGGTATFFVGTLGPQTGVTYQWRRNLSPLANNGHVSGATSSTLVINNACTSDAGTYDVVVTSSSAPGGPAVEVSRQASLQISTATGIADVALEPRALTVSAAAPNPFGGETKFRYEAPSQTRVTMAIYNVTGARVRVLMDREVSGAGTVAWDGRIQSGARAPAGIYFLRVDDGVRHEHRKIILLK